VFDGGGGRNCGERGCVIGAGGGEGLPFSPSLRAASEVFVDGVNERRDV